MVYVFLVLTVGLCVAAVRAETRGMRVWFAVWAVLNFAGAVKAVVTEDPYAFKLRPNTGPIDYDPPYRR